MKVEIAVLFILYFSMHYYFDEDETISVFILYLQSNVKWEYLLHGKLKEYLFKTGCYAQNQVNIGICETYIYDSNIL